MSTPTIENGPPLTSQDQWAIPAPGELPDPESLAAANGETETPAPLADSATPTTTTTVTYMDDLPTMPGKGSGVTDIAKDWLGVKYVYGGNNRQGIDCSGLTQQVYKAAFGISLPRISYQQANGGDRIGWDKMKAGDLVAWDNSSRNNGADHIAIYMGNGWIIEAPHPGALVRLRKLDFNGYDAKAWGVTYR
jgi:cell wall-associated NlpC family hydrolase